MLRVTNNSDRDLTDMFDGNTYNFPRGASVLISENAAKHIFGFGEGDKTPYLARQGWMRQSIQYEDAMKTLSGFVFSDGDVPEAPAPIEQGLAPLHLVAAEEAASDGAVESAVPIPPARGRGRNVLQQLSGG